MEIRFNQKAFVFNERGQFLILKRAYTNEKWDLPGGKVEIPELHEVALRREIQEETSLEVKNLHAIAIQTAFGDNEKYYISAGFRCESLPGEIILSPEHTEFKWVTKTEFLEIDATPYLKDLARELN